MPRFFFSIKRDGTVIPDHEGDDLPDVDAALALAAEIVGDMLRLPHVYGAAREWQRNEFIITDERGATLLAVSLAQLISR